MSNGSQYIWSQFFDSPKTRASWRKCSPSNQRPNRGLFRFPGRRNIFAPFYLSRRAPAPLQPPSPGASSASLCRVPVHTAPHPPCPGVVSDRLKFMPISATLLSVSVDGCFRLKTLYIYNIIYARFPCPGFQEAWPTRWTNEQQRRPARSYPRGTD
jgi:hypothetical protein